MTRAKTRTAKRELSAAFVDKTKTPGRYADTNGLYLHVDSPTARFFVWRGTVEGKRIIVSIGSTRQITLAGARETAARYSETARSGGDPRKLRDIAEPDVMTFSKAAELAYASNIKDKNGNAKHKAQWITTLRTYAFPIIGDKSIAEIKGPDIVKVLLPIWNDIPETASRVRQRMSAVFEWAIFNNHREMANPVTGVQRSLPKQARVVKHHRALDWHELPALMRQLEAAAGIGALAVRFAILTAARSGEVRGATWREIDLTAKRWTVPAERMKMKRAHAVPLSDAAIKVLGNPGDPDALIFPGMRGGPLSDMSLSAVLKRLKIDATVHGFRSSFRTWAEEATDYPRSVVETALAHSASENAVEAAYLRSDLFQRRIALMREWSTVITS